MLRLDIPGTVSPVRLWRNSFRGFCDKPIITILKLLNGFTRFYIFQQSEFPQDRPFQSLIKIDSVMNSPATINPTQSFKNFVKYLSNIPESEIQLLIVRVYKINTLILRINSTNCLADYQLIGYMILCSHYIYSIIHSLADQYILQEPKWKNYYSHLSF